MTSSARTRERGTSARRRLKDSAARWIVTAGGLAIIASILGILLFILVEVWPLTGGAEVEPGPTLTTSSGAGLLVDEHRSHAVILGRDGRLSVVELETGEVVEERELLTRRDGEAGPVALQPVPSHGRPYVAAASRDGRVTVVPLGWDVGFDGDVRRVSALIGDPIVFDFGSDAAIRNIAATVDEDGVATAVAQLADGGLVRLRREVEQALFSEEVTELWERDTLRAPREMRTLVLDADGANLYGIDAGGDLVWWKLTDPRPQPSTYAMEQPATALTLLIGDRSLIAGREDGAVEVWFQVRREGNEFDLTRIRTLPSIDGAIRELAPSLRNKGFVAVTESDRIALYYSTSARLMWEGAVPVDPVLAVAFAPKDDALYVAGEGRLAALEVDNPHPDISLRTLFGKVWYEGYEEEAFVWQSTGGTDEFESKMSLVPLLVGTFKGTFYSLLLAVPLGILGAMYTSQFMHGSLKRWVKPTVEIMAALPSVVLGFLAGLWLAPRVEEVLPALILMLLVLPVTAVAGDWLWRRLPSAFRGRFPLGAEALFMIGLLALAMWGCLHWSAPFEGLAFGGDFQTWLLETFNLPFDQRNAVVVGIGMGFAVIPIIFAISEDAFSNVPRNLTSGSLALGANRWQTVTRVVLPTASPGIFSAVMVGFGRAIGETMIVLMAAGNTPILDWNAFNGFRTLSANIATEIPEAPQGDTLYRTLFLAALLLFALTFLINTVAELVRQRLRRRYANI